MKEAGKTSSVMKRNEQMTSQELSSCTEAQENKYKYGQVMKTTGV